MSISYFQAGDPTEYFQCTPEFKDDVYFQGVIYQRTSDAALPAIFVTRKMLTSCWLAGKQAEPSYISETQ